MENDLNEDPFAPDGPVEQACALFMEMKLPIPPMPEALLPLLQHKSDTVFSTRTGMNSLVDRAAQVSEAASGTLIPGLSFSHEGHGTNNWHLRCYVVLPQVAVFIELPFGGAYTSEHIARSRIENAFSSLQRLLQAAADTTTEDQYVVEHLGIRGSRWCLAGDDAEWHEEDNAIDAVTDRLSA